MKIAASVAGCGYVVTDEGHEGLKFESCPCASLSIVGAWVVCASCGTVYDNLCGKAAGFPRRDWKANA
jgi:hypothetical protein